MQNYKDLEKLSEKDFRRLTGVKRSTFEVMLVIIREAIKRSEKRGGRKRKLSVADCLLLCLEYLREYRSYLHLGFSYGISESQARKTQQWVEKILITDTRFHLPNRKELQALGLEFEVYLVDATECEIERPKKNKN